MTMFRRPALTALVALAVSCEVVYVLAFLRPYPLLPYYRRDNDLGGISGHSAAAFWVYIVAFVLLFVLLAAGIKVVERSAERGATAVVFVASAVFMVTLAFVYPITATDVYTYIAQSWILVHYHLNPIFVPPSAVPGDPLMPLAASWMNYTAAYGPAALLIDAVPSVVAQGNLLVNLLGLKLLMGCFVLADAYLVYRILMAVAPTYAVSGAAMVAWNPLVLFESCANGHNDVIMLFFALLAILLLVRGDDVLSPVMMVVSGLVKFATFLLILPAGVHALAHRGRRTWLSYLLQVGVLSLTVGAGLYVRFWQGPSTLSRPLLENSLHIESFSSVIADLAPGAFSLDSAATAGKILYVPLLLLFLWMARGDRVRLLQACYLCVFFLLALAVSNFKIWYGVWPMLLGATVPSHRFRVSALALGCGASISAALYAFLWPWLGLSNAASFPTVNNLSYILTFVPALCALLWPLVHSRVQKAVPAGGRSPVPVGPEEEVAAG